MELLKRRITSRKKLAAVQKASLGTPACFFAATHGCKVPRLIEKKKASETYGFLAIAGDARDGMVGGCLLLNGRGRPLEFHCTAPVRPNRAQVILYGPTLRPYVVGEQIAATLLAKSKLSPTILWTDDLDVLSVREAVDFPIGCLHENPGSALSLDVGGGLHAQVHEHYAEDLQRIARHGEATAAWIDLREPFQRIQEAITEALKVNAKPAA
jgi:hypothetical protein